MRIKRSEWERLIIATQGSGVEFEAEFGMKYAYFDKWGVIFEIVEDVEEN